MTCRPLGSAIVVVLLLTALPARGDLTPVETSGTVVLTNGSGTGQLHFAMQKGLMLPPVVIAQPPTAPGGTVLPGQVNVTAADGSVDAPHIATVTISVFGASAAMMNVVYTGKIAMLLDTPVTVPFTVSSASSSTFEVTPATVSTSIGYGDPLTRAIRIRNTGTTPLRIVKIDTLGFTNADSRYYAGAAADPPAAIAAGSAATVTVPLPAFDRAGTYTGGFEVSADSGAHQSATFTVAARGPYVLQRGPVVFFLIVGTVGFWLALLIERRWSEGALQRLEAERALRKARTSLDTVRTELRQWNQAHEFALTIVIRRIDAQTATIDSRLSTIDDIVLTDLPEVVASAQNSASLAGIFLSVLTRVTGETADALELRKMARAMDIVPQQGTPAEYANALVNAANTVGRGAFASDTAPTALRTGNDVTRDIKRIERVRDLALFVVALVIAAQLHYQGHPQFGTVWDYVAVFLWSLAVTKGGAQLINSIRH